EAANVLVDAGASLDSRNNDGARPQDLLSIDWGTTSMIARAVGLPLDRKALSEGRIEIAEMMQSTFGVEDIAVLGTEADDSISFRQLGGLLFELPIFHHLWFLWFLCWLVIGFVIAVKAIEVLGLTKLPKRWLLTPRSLLWLVPLTTIPQMFMGRIPGTFGPDTSIGLLPLPAVLGYYAIFFGFGALYFGADDRDQRLGRHGGWMVFLSVVVVFPIGLSLQGFSGPIAQTIYAGVQVLYAWLMSFGMIGLFHRCLSRNRPWVRYISDSSYWLYLAHLPLVMLLQYAVESVAAPAAIKFVGVCTVTTVLLLLSYQLMVRKTWIGVLLNGRRYGVAKRSAN
ncbi:MAG: acyltransferase, partial [Planctomycetota bacterium]